MHRTRAAQRHAAAQLRAGDAEYVAQHPEERRVAVYIDAVCIAVDFNGEGHGFFPFLPVAIKRELPSCLRPQSPYAQVMRSLSAELGNRRARGNIRRIPAFKRLSVFTVPIRGKIILLCGEPSRSPRAGV